MCAISVSQIFKSASSLALAASLRLFTLSHSQIRRLADLHFRADLCPRCAILTSCDLCMSMIDTILHTFTYRWEASTGRFVPGLQAASSTSNLRLAHRWQKELPATCHLRLAHRWHKENFLRPVPAKSRSRRLAASELADLKIWDTLFSGLSCWWPLLSSSIGEAA